MAGEHSFPISPNGSKAPKSSDLRGQMKFKLLTVSEYLVFPNNVKVKPCRYKRCFPSIFTAPGTNDEIRQKIRRARIFQVSGKIFNSVYYPEFLYVNVSTVVAQATSLSAQKRKVPCSIHARDSNNIHILGRRKLVIFLSPDYIFG